MSTTTQPPAPRPYRTPAAVRRALFALAALTGAFIVAGGVVSLLDLAARKTTEEVRTYAGIRSLDIADASDVRLTTAPAGSQLRVRARVTEGLRSPERDVRRVGGGTLELSSSCPILFSGSCGVDYEIAVPAGTAVRVDAKGGDVDAEDLVSTHPVRLQTSGGDISATDVTAPELRLSSSAGDVEATGVRAAIVDADSSGGDVSLSLRTAPDRLDANSSAGDVELVLPDETYRVDASTSAGDVDDSQVRNDPDSPRIVHARSSAGDIRIESRR
jgi:Putative adhesin